MNINSYMDILSLTGLFNGITREDLHRLFNVNQYSVTPYKKGSIIYFESETCTSLDIVLGGEITIQKIDEKGNVLTITEFQTGDNIGGNLLFSRYPYYPMSVISKSDSEILHIKKELVLKLCQSNQDFLLNFLICISDKTAILTSKIKTISLKSIRELIIDFLNYEYYVQKRCEIKLHMTKKELAEKMGIQRTSLSRELNKMKNDGLIDYNAHSITILNINLLRKR